MAFEIKDDNLSEVLSQNNVVLVDVWAEWCGPCRILGPTIDEVASEYESKEGVVVGKCNVDENSTIATDYKVRSIPTVIVFKNGEEAKRIVGANSKQTYIDAIEELVG